MDFIENAQSAVCYKLFNLKPEIDTVGIARYLKYDTSKHRYISKIFDYSLHSDKVKKWIMVVDLIF